MITALIIGLGSIALGMTAMAHWSEIVGWIKDFVSSLVQIFTTVAVSVAHAAGVFVKEMAQGIAGIMHKLYYKENGQYIERVTTRTLPESEVPDWVKAKLSAQETNMSNEFRERLQLQL
mgnify:CR=1 FL=1